MTPIAHLAYALLVAAALAAQGTRIRMLLGAAGAAGLADALMRGNDPAAIAWMAALLGAALLPLTLRGRNPFARRGARFTDQDRKVADSLVAGVSEQRARHLIDQGLWLSGDKGDMLTREGEPIENLYYLAEGEARVMSMGRQVGTCGPGDLIGELTILSGERASATVILDGPARFWCAPAKSLRPYVEAHEDIKRAVGQGIAGALKAKVRAANRTIAQGQG